MTTNNISPEQLVDLARDKTRQGRSALLTAIIKLYDGDGQRLTGQDQTMIKNIICQLLNNVETSVRQALAEHIAESTETPKDLVIALANDDIHVAYPILLKSEILKDDELIEIIQHRTMEHQVAIAMRRFVSAPVSDALVETGADQVVTTLLENDGAQEAILECLRRLARTNSREVRLGRGRSR